MTFSVSHVLTAYVADLLLGDPPSWPHPVRWIGRLIEKAEGVFYLDSERKSGFSTVLEPDGASDGRLRVLGIAFWMAVLGAVGAVVTGALLVCHLIHPFPAALLGVWIAYTCLATRSLYDESAAVARALSAGRLQEARRLLSRIVSRDTGHLDEEGIWRALVETVSENLSDGVVAPLFYLALAGPVGAVVYKTVNTLDSMVGYNNERYRDFGWFSARMDDLFNYVPARLTAVLLLAAGTLWGLDLRRGWAVLKRDARKHKSPNAGFPEAAVAGLLGVQLGGPGVYFGRAVEKPSLGDPLTVPDERAFRHTTRLLFTVSAAAAFLAALARALWG
ncbi:adenosylcobinamide-phosphate synthase [Desulfacinum hydrothermale DSM 13146]|uniref:Cobalamin biosynthesis protein CobD n=1 Tax=Desulfacinum hydrothermale DSM 13146 TaxID=1121390 RepID=A0A1W1XNJ2_9BACT|nr:adenosylcobinamide-phosphate synthase CbiB [Desulfacinum hydrothermale]SMC25415.1 adenosylcobinamide-phosphate synthase [Desulfacinum hydrothermale DSM 13146]